MGLAYENDHVGIARRNTIRRLAAENSAFDAPGGKHDLH